MENKMATTPISKDKVSSRILWVDIYKALAIILMVSGHAASTLNGFLYTFHIPAFFFISGYTANFNKDNFAGFLSKKANQLLKPYLIFNFIFFLFHYITQKLNVSPFFYADAAGPKLNLISIANQLLGFTQTDPLGGATWFLVTLFETTIISYILFHLFNRYFSKSKLMLFCLSFILLIFSYRLLYPHFPFTVLIYNLDLIPISLFFFVCGFFLQNFQPNLSNKYHLFLLIALSALSFYFFKVIPSPINFPTRSFGNMIYVLPSALSGIILLVLISKLIELIPFQAIKSFFIYTGQSTLNILIFHFSVFKLFFILLFLLKLQSLSFISNLVPLTTYQYWFPLVTFTVITILVIQKLFSRNIFKIYTYFSKYYPTILIVLITLIFQSWILSSNNFFFQDDFSHLANSIGHIPFNLIPHQVYNDRPVGTLFIKFLFSVFGFHYRYHHGILLTLHIINALLVYFVFIKISKYFFKQKKEVVVISLLTALLFANWPKSIMAASWDSAIFDLLLTTLSLIFFNLIFYFSTIFPQLLSVIVFLFMVRTKESAVFLPFIPLLYVIFFTKKIKKHLALIISCLLGVVYFIYLFILGKTGGFSQFTPDNPYFTSFNPVTLIRNIFIYFYLYINPNIGGFSFTKFIASDLLLPSIFILSILFLCILNKKYILIASFLIISLLPVLPLVNTQHKLYLYLPSIFFAYLLVTIVYLILSKLTKYSLVALFVSILLLIIYQNFYNPIYLMDKNWWLDTGNTNHLTFENLKNIPAPDPNKILYVSNITDKSTSIFLYGPGHVLNAYYKNPQLKTILIDNPSQISLQKNYCLINYNSGQLKLLGCK